MVEQAEMKPLERAAAEIRREFSVARADGDDLDARCLRAARAVLQAIREPDEEMSEAGAELIRNVGRAESEEAYQSDAVNTWRYMIDAALGE